MPLSALPLVIVARPFHFTDTTTTWHHGFMAWMKIGTRWLNFAGPFVLSAVIFAGVLVWFGDPLVRAIAFSLTFNAVAALLDLQHGRVRDAKRRRQQQGMYRPGYLRDS